MGNSVEFTDNRIEIKQTLNKKSLNWLEEVAAEIESQVKQNTRVDTGATKKAWRTVVDREKGQAAIGNTLENAIWEEFGTGEYAVNGDGRKGRMVL